MAEATSNVESIKVGDSERDFRTITTHENGQIKKTVIQETTTLGVYNEYAVTNPDLVSVKEYDNGQKRYFRTVKTDNNYSIFADVELQRGFEEKGAASLQSQLDDQQAQSLADATGAPIFQWRSEQKRRANVLATGEEPPQTFSISPDDFSIEAKRQTVYDNLFYPEDIATSKQDKIRFSMFYQTGRSLGFDLSSEQSPFAFGSRNVTNIEGSVTLPIQSGIQDTNQVDYQRGTLNPVTGALASIALDPLAFGNQIVNLLNSDASDIQDMLGSPSSKNMINALRVYLAQTAVNTQGLLPRTTGAILNPNIELLLQAPQLRSFQFNFRMSARDATEASQIRKIIRFFKQGMSVKRSQTSLFIVSPNMFRIQYLAGTDGNLSKDHPSIGKIKDCALTAINTQYTPDGTYMTFDDESRSMTSYQINMQFTELEPLTETDYIETAANPESIGY